MDDKQALRDAITNLVFDWNSEVSKLPRGKTISFWHDEKVMALIDAYTKQRLKGASATSDKPKQPKDSKSLTEVMASLELPWPKDVFGEVPKDEWHEIDEFAKTRGYRVDTISGDLMRRGWKVYERLLRERVTELVDEGFVVSTDVTNPPKLAQLKASTRKGEQNE